MLCERKFIDLANTLYNCYALKCIYIRMINKRAISYEHTYPIYSVALILEKKDGLKLLALVSI